MIKPNIEYIFEGVSTIFSKEFLKNPIVEITVTLECVFNGKIHPKGHPEHIDTKKGDKIQVSFIPPFETLILREETFPLRGKVEKGREIYRIISIDRVRIMEENIISA